MSSKRVEDTQKVLDVPQVKDWLDECRTPGTRKLYEYGIKVFSNWYGKPMQTYLDLDQKEKG